MDSVLKETKFRQVQAKHELAFSVAEYLNEYSDFDNMTKYQVAVAAVRLLTDDIGAAQDFLRAIGVNVDLYTYNYTNNVRVEG